MIEKILVSKFFLYLCLYLFPLSLIQNWIYDYPNRLQDIYGNGFIFIVAIMYLWGMIISLLSEDKESINLHSYLHLFVWGFGFAASIIFTIFDKLGSG